MLAFKEVGFALEADHFHKGEWVGNSTMLWLTQLSEESIRTELDVLHREHCTHSDETTGDGCTCKVAFHFDCILCDGVHSEGCCQVKQLVADQAGEVAVHVLIVACELIGLAQTRQHSLLFDPALRKSLGWMC